MCEDTIKKFKKLGYSIRHLDEFTEFRCYLIKEYNQDIYQEVLIKENEIICLVKCNIVIDCQETLDNIQRAFNRVKGDYLEVTGKQYK